MDMKQRVVRLGIIWAVAMALVCGGLAGCASDQEKKAEHLSRAEKYVAEKKYKAAVIEFKNVIQLDPKDDAALYKLGEAYLNLRKGQKAFECFYRAVGINPDNLGVQLRIGQAMLLQKDTEKAAEKARMVLDAEPGNL